MTFDDPAVQRAARRSGALAGLGLFWFTLLVSLGLIWIALGAVVATVVGVGVLLGARWHPHIDVRRRRRALRRRVRAVDEAIGRRLMAGGARTRAATRSSAAWTRRVSLRDRVRAVDEAIGRRLMAGGARTRITAKTSAAWTRRASVRAGAAAKSASAATATAAAAGAKAASAKTAGSASAAREWARSHPLPKPESPVPSLREAVSHVPAIELPQLPRRRPRAQGHKLAHESVVARREGRVDDAIAVGREAVEAFREADDRRGEALALNTLALALAQDHRYGEAVAALDGAITLLGELGDRHREGTVLVNLGTLHRQAGGVESARFCWRKALERLDPASPESHETERLLRAS